MCRFSRVPLLRCPLHAHDGITKEGGWRFFTPQVVQPKPSPICFSKLNSSTGSSYTELHISQHSKWLICSGNYMPVIVSQNADNWQNGNETTRQPRPVACKATRLGEASPQRQSSAKCTGAGGIRCDDGLCSGCSLRRQGVYCQPRASGQASSLPPWRAHSCVAPWSRSHQIQPAHPGCRGSRNLALPSSNVDV